MQRDSVLRSDLRIFTPIRRGRRARYHAPLLPRGFPFLPPGPWAHKYPSLRTSQGRVGGDGRRRTETRVVMFREETEKTMMDSDETFV